MTRRQSELSSEASGSKWVRESFFPEDEGCARISRVYLGKKRHSELVSRKLLTIVSDGLSRTSNPCFLGEGDLFRTRWLAMDVSVAAFIVAGEELWSCIATEIAVDARRIDVIRTGNVLRGLAISICH